jgi:hypothetical protein
VDVVDVGLCTFLQFICTEVLIAAIPISSILLMAMMARYAAADGSMNGVVSV